MRKLRPGRPWDTESALRPPRCPEVVRPRGPGPSCRRSREGSRRSRPCSSRAGSPAPRRLDKPPLPRRPMRRSRGRDRSALRASLIGRGRGCGWERAAAQLSSQPGEPGAGGAHEVLLCARPPLAGRAAPGPLRPPGRGTRPSPPLPSPPGPGLGRRAGAGREPRDERLRWVRSGRRGGPAGSSGSGRRTDPASRREEAGQVAEPAPGRPRSRALEPAPRYPPQPPPPPLVTPRPPAAVASSPLLPFVVCAPALSALCSHLLPRPDPRPAELLGTRPHPPLSLSSVHLSPQRCSSTPPPRLPRSYLDPAQAVTRLFLPRDSSPSPDCLTYNCPTQPEPPVPPQNSFVGSAAVPLVLLIFVPQLYQTPAQTPLP